MSIREFLAMGGYAAYVWPSYGLALAVLVGNVWLAARRRRKLMRDIAVQLRDPETRI
jgi:heme exporter protein D